MPQKTAVAAKAPNQEQFRFAPEVATQNLVRELRGLLHFTEPQLAQYLGTSFVSVVRWERGDILPTAADLAKLHELRARVDRGDNIDVPEMAATHVFASRGVREREEHSDIDSMAAEIEFTADPQSPIFERLQRGGLWGNSVEDLSAVLLDRVNAATTIENAAAEGVSAGKNTYTYDAHTYHTKVPPQGIAEVIRRYLPEGGVVLDPFSGSGMTGVAALTLGNDVILNELSPAASFISERFTRTCDPNAYASAVQAILGRLEALRRDLYTTTCRECGDDTEILYTVWSYKVSCGSCNHTFVLWDHCRQYGRTVREHKILKEFPCPRCGTVLKKSRLPRTQSVPVLVGYRCCSKKQIEHPPTAKDLERVQRLENAPPLAEPFVPRTPLPDGVNLCQPKRHGLDSIDRFYTGRNLAAMSHLWKAIHQIGNLELAGFLAFTFTSLYQRVTKLSEFRFWGGSGNTANFNVPYIMNEANVFVTFERKARTIQDHLATTAQFYNGRRIVRTGSATDLYFLPDASVDLVFTDPPFGANINYSEMNILWESWFGAFTNSANEAIVNKFQGKDVLRYGELMTSSLRECHRVLREGHWMLVVFMNSSEDVWASVRDAVKEAGFSLERVDIFDKQHGTFKQFVSENTAGCDLLLHCRKTKNHVTRREAGSPVRDDVTAVSEFLRKRKSTIPRLPYLHVKRQEEIDYRMLYSEFLSEQLVERAALVDFSVFRSAAATFLEQ